MPRSARITAPGLVHHVTHRGNRRCEIFFDREDRETYLRWLSGASERHGLEIWTYCLMTNHIHLLARGLSALSLAAAMRDVQGRYARYVNEKKGWSGHLWSSRFFSDPVAPEYLLEVARYIERNHVRAGMVQRAEEYLWSSARAHCGLAGAGLLSPRRPFPGEVSAWRSFLEGSDPTLEDSFRRAVRTGRPAGEAAFSRELERELGRPLQARPRGRPSKIR